jgi:hypothetical protein
LAILVAPGVRPARSLAGYLSERSMAVVAKKLDQEVAKPERMTA